MKPFPETWEEIEAALQNTSRVDFRASTSAKDFAVLKEYSRVTGIESIYVGSLVMALAVKYAEMRSAETKLVIAAVEGRPK